MNPKKIMLFSVGPIGSAILGLITLPMVAWFFPSEDLGRLSMLKVAISFSLLLFSLGLDQAYVREYHEAKNKAVLLKSTILPGLVILSLILPIIAISPWSLSDILFGIDSVYITLLLCLGMFFSFNSRFLSLILRMQERGLAFSLSNILPKLLFFIIISIYILFDFEPIFEYLIQASVVSITAVFFIFSWNTRKQWIDIFSVTIDKNKLREMISYSIPLIGGGLAFWGLTAMDKFFLRALSSFEELGIYSITISFAGVALVFQSVFSTVWAPTIYKWSAEGVNEQRVQNVIDSVVFAVTVIWSLVGFFSWVVPYILPLEYSKVQFILLTAIAYPLLYTLSEATGVGIGVKRKTLYSMGVAIIALIINGLGNYVLIPILGAAGASITSAISFFCFFIIKTEISSNLWVNIKRFNMYLLILSLVVLSVLVNIVEVDIWINQLIWTGVILTSSFIYKVKVRKTYFWIRGFLNKGG